MSQCVPSWDLEDINPDHDVFKFDCEAVELTWENGELTMHELNGRRVPSKSQSTASWDKPRATETLEALVNQATHQSYGKPQVTVNDDELVPWLHHDTPAVAAGSVNASATLTSDALVPSSNNPLNKSIRDAGCSTRVGSCSGDPSAFVSRTMAHGGGTAAVSHDWTSCQDLSVSRSGTFGTFNSYDRDLGGRRLTSTSTGSPENTSSGKDCSKSTSPDDSFYHCRTEHEEGVVNEKKRGRAKPTISNKRRRTAAIHNQSERKRRDIINQRMKTLQKLVPNSSKTDKASMLDEVIEHVKQLQAQAQLMSRMTMPQMMMPLAIQPQQLQMSMMSSMGMGMGMGFGVGMGGMDMNTIGHPNIPTGYHPSFMHMPLWNAHTTDHVAAATMANDPMSAFLAYRSQPMNMDAYNRMAALYQHMQNQPSGQQHK